MNHPNISFDTQPTSAVSGGNLGPVTVTFSVGGSPLAGVTLEIALGNYPCSGSTLTGGGPALAPTDSNGKATWSGLSVSGGGWGYTLVVFNPLEVAMNSTSEPFDVEGFCQADGMNYPKLGATITTLRDGRVLVAGGNPAGNFSEIFDPEAGSGGLWARFLHGGVEGLGILRALHTATLLNDGTVLVTGGYAGLLPAGGGALDSVVIFDPETETFTRQVETLTVPRMEHTATKLSDGRVLISGGLSDSADSTYLDSAEIYDPSDGSITPLENPMYSPRAHHTATPLSNGKILLVGGLSGPFSYLRSAEIFDPLTGGGTFTEVTIGMTVSRMNHTATLLTNGKVLVAGGHSGLGTVLPTADVYDPVTDSFWPVPGGMTTRRTLHTAAPLPDGRVLITGGDNGSGAIATAEVYDPVADGCFPAGSMGSARSNHLAASLHDGRVLVAGASGLSSELYLPAFPARFRAVDGLSDKRAQHTAIQIFGGDVLVLGGSRPHPSLPGWLEGSVTIERFNAATGDFTTVASLPEPRWQQSATRLLDGDVLIAGGISGAGGTAMSSALLFDPESNTITPTGSMNVARWGHSATLLADGKVLIARGRNPGDVLIDVTEIYDPVSGTFTFAGSMPDDRSGHTATLLQDGRVLIAGGRTSVGADPSLTSALIYSPSLGLFTSVGDMNEGRQGHGATLLQDGRVLSQAALGTA